MKKTAINLLVSLVGASMLALNMPLSACAEDGSQYVRASLRIEGISSCICDKEVFLPAKDSSVTAADILSFADELDDSFALTGLADGYITAVNGDTAASFGGWDGWLFTVNGESSPVGMNDTEISDGDDIVLYFGDPYGVGMQFPNMSREENTLTFTSLDTFYDETGNPFTVENPVADMTVFCGGEKYITDENGSVTVSAPTSVISYEKYAESGLPLVLRSKQPAVKGDINGDSIVNAVDASAILSAYAQIATGHGAVISAGADADSNGTIDSVDASRVLSYYAAVATGSKYSSIDEFLAK